MPDMTMCTSKSCKKGNKVRWIRILREKMN